MTLPIHILNQISYEEDDGDFLCSSSLPTPTPYPNLKGALPSLLPSLPSHLDVGCIVSVECLYMSSVTHTLPVPALWAQQQ